MYTQNSASSIDPALRALLAVAKQVTPAGQPTVAAQVAQAAQKPQGIMSALDQSQQAAPSVAQNMQQQQMAEAAQQMQQMQPQPPAEAQPPQPEQPAGGIASLPIPEQQYAEGGVIGYSGQEGSWVGEEEATSEAGDFFRKLLSGAMGSFGDIPEALRKRALAAKLGSGIVAMKPDVFESLTPRQRESRLTQASQMEAMLAALRGQPATRETPRPEAGVAEAPDTSPAAKIALNQKIQELSPQIPPPDRRGAQSRPEEVGILTPREPQAMSASGRPTAEEAKRIAGSLVPQQDTTESQRLYDLYRSTIQGRPDFESQKAAAMEQAYAKETGGRDMERAIRLLTATARQGLPGIGVEGLQYRKEKDAIDAAYQQGQIAQREAAQAKAEGNIANLMAANQKISDAKQKYDELTAVAGRTAYGDLTNQFTAELQAKERGLDRSSAERIARMGGVQGAMLDLFQRDPALFAAFNQATTGSKKSGMSPQEIRQALIDRWLKMEPMEKAILQEKEGISTVDQFVTVYSPKMSGQDVAAPSNAPAPQAAIDYLKKYGVPQ